MNYPYSTATGSISPILTKIQSVGKPATVNKKWLSSIGFKKDSEQRIIGILKFLLLVDEKGVPTDLWTQFRSIKTGKSVLGSAIKNAYKELYDIYPNAHELANDELSDFFSTRTSAGALALTHTINTFKNLAGFADFGHATEEPVAQSPTVGKKGDNSPPVEKPVQPISQSPPIHLAAGKDVAININIQLTVPETTNEEVYQKFFEAMKKHLLS